MNNKWREFFNNQEIKYDPNLSLISEDDFEDLKDYSQILNEAEELLGEKKDACYRKVKSRYKSWPSAYASGALVKCRKVGAKNWGNSTNEEMELEEETIEEKRKYRQDKDYDKEELSKGSKHELEHTRGKSDKSDKDNAEMTAKDHLDDDPEYYDKLEKANIDERKLTSKPASETNLRDWFKRKGAKGSTGGWVDCNSPDGEGGYKSCGRGSGEKRKRYPACRPTPSACKKMKGSKGKSWGKKDAKSKGNKK